MKIWGMVFLVLLVCCANLYGKDIFKAIESWDLKAIQTYIKNGGSMSVTNDKGMNPLMTAVNFQYIEAVKALVEAGSSINDIYNEGWNAVLIASTVNLDILKYLVSKGGKLNVRDGLGQTPLLMAVEAKKWI